MACILIDCYISNLYLGLFRLITTLLGTNIYPTVWHFWVDDASRLPMWDVSVFFLRYYLFLDTWNWVNYLEDHLTYTPEV